MYIPGSFLILFAGLLSLSWAIPYLHDNGYRDILSNEPVLIEDTLPTVNIKSQALPLTPQARFVLVLDYSNGMTQDTMDRLKTTSIRWISQLGPGTYVAIVKFGTSATLVYDWVEATGARRQLIATITDIIPNGGGSCMSCGLQYAGELMLDPNSPYYGGVVMVVTGSVFNDGTDVGDPSVWLVFKEFEIRVLTLLMGTEKDTNVHALARATEGKVFTVNYDGSDLDGIFDWASQTFIPAEVANDYEWLIADMLFIGRDWIFCHFRCVKFSVSLDDQINNKDVVIYIEIRYKGQNDTMKDFVDSVSVTDLNTGNIIDGYSYTLVFEGQRLLLKDLKPGNFQVDITLKKRISVQSLTSVKVTGHRRSPSIEPYIVQCQYPYEINQDKKYSISGFVKQGRSTVKGATIFARISKSQYEDPSGLERSCIIKLIDDGQHQISGDLIAFDGVYTNTLDPKNCWDYPSSNGERMQVLCTLAPSPDAKVTNDEFFSKRNLNIFGQPRESDSVTSNQTWSHDRDVKFVSRNTYNTSIKVEDLE